MLQTFDTTLFHWINYALSNSFLDFILPFFDGNRLFIPLILLILGLMIWKGGRKAWIYIACLGIAIAITDGVVAIH